jgi:hypothetical protein
MNIILNKSLKTDSKQPKVFRLGQITTTLQDLLDNSTIVINGEQTIILLVIDENNNVLKYLLPLDYKGESFYGLGKNILEGDLILINNSKLDFLQPTRKFSAKILQDNVDDPFIVENYNNIPNIIIERKDVGVFAIQCLDIDFTTVKYDLFFQVQSRLSNDLTEILEYNEILVGPINPAFPNNIPFYKIDKLNSNTISDTFVAYLILNIYD